MHRRQARPLHKIQSSFARDIQPILEKSCASCHSADLKLADLDLSTRDAAIKGGEHGAAIVPGSAERSKLYRMVAGLDVPAMPMEGERSETAGSRRFARNQERGSITGACDAAARRRGSADRCRTECFARDIQPIIEKTCWNCHSATCSSPISI